MQDNSLVDRDHLSMIAGSDPAPLLPLYEEFADSVTESLRAAWEALQAGDRVLAKAEIHKIKGSAGSLGFPPLHRDLAQLESQVVEGAPVSAEAVNAAAALAHTSASEATAFLHQLSQG